MPRLLRRLPCCMLLVATTALSVVPPVLAADPIAGPNAMRPDSFVDGTRLPTGKRITPTVSPGAELMALNPRLPEYPDFLAGQAVALAPSPDGDVLLVLTSGYNRINDANGELDPAGSNEYVFVFDITSKIPTQLQALTVPNTFNGITWAPDSSSFYVSGGVDDNIHVFTRDIDSNGQFVEDGDPIKLNHAAGNGINIKPAAAGLAVSPDGQYLLVANHENDSVSLVDLRTRSVAAEQDLRPGKIDPTRQGVPGGEYPFKVAWQSSGRAYVSAPRDREIVALTVADGKLSVAGRIQTTGEPTALLVDAAGKRLYATADNTDSLIVVDAEDGDLLAEIPVTAPTDLLPPNGLKGSNPNDLVLSRDGRTLLVSLGGINAVAVVDLEGKARGEEEDDDRRDHRGEGRRHDEKLGFRAEQSGPDGERSGRGHDDDEYEHGIGDVEDIGVVGLIPTAWYPHAVAVGTGNMIYVANGKSEAGPNPKGCRNTLSTAPDASAECSAANQYIWQLEKASLLSLPAPSGRELARLTWQTAYNNDFPIVQKRQDGDRLMGFLRERIKHVIYIIKENRTYDQVLGDLEVGNGDPALAIFPNRITPNHHQLARQFTTIDNFYDSGEVSNTGWSWSTAARATDMLEKSAPVNYAGRGLAYESEGTNRNINVAIPTSEERAKVNKLSPTDPDILPGTADLTAPDAPSGEAGEGFLWDSALRAGLSVRNYGFFADLALYDNPAPNAYPLEREPAKTNTPVFVATNVSLAERSDPYFRGYDQKFPDYWRVVEWEREFDQQVASNSVPNLTLMRLPHDHFGAFTTAIDRVNTVETQMADNDYAISLVVEKIAKSPVKDSTLIFIIEDDAQDGGDHVDGHRSIAYIIGPYVKQKAVVSHHYTTVSMLRTIEDVLGIQPLGLNDGLTTPMSEVFDTRQRDWTYKAIFPAPLNATDLPKPAAGAAGKRADAGDDQDACIRPVRSAAYWEEAMKGQNFAEEDHLDTDRFNQALWAGMMGEDAPLPTRHGRDMSHDREAILTAWRAGGC